MTAATDGIGVLYQEHLLRYLDAPGESALAGGYELGRSALSGGLGVLDIAAVHSNAIVPVFNRDLDAGERARLLEAQTAFFIEALSPFEMAHRGFRDANGMLRRLNGMLEGQAKRIASALHSEAGQLLATVHLALADAGRDVSDETAQHLAKVKTLLVDIESRLRNLSHELRPPVLEDLGLAAAIELLADTISKRWHLAVAVRVSIDGDLPAMIENTIYRIVHEALTNTAKHAGASNAEIELRMENNRIICSVRDDGVGFDNTAGFRKRRPGLGLTEIRECVAALGGALRLGVNRDQGTDLTIELPMDA